MELGSYYYLCLEFLFLQLFFHYSWMEACIDEELSATTELEESLRNGVALAKLAHFMSPEAVPIKRVYDRDQNRYAVRRSIIIHS